MVSRRIVAIMVTRAIGLVLLAIIAGSLLWIASERHYRACLEQRLYTGTGVNREFGFDGLGDPPPLSAVSAGDCSRFPF